MASGVAMGWVSWAKSREPPECRGPEFQANLKKNNFSTTVKIRRSGNQTLECFIVTLPTSV